MTSTSGQRGRPLQVAIAVGDAERERPLVRAIDAAGMHVVARCVDATSLLDLELGRCDAVLLSRGLHRLTADVLAAIREQLVPAVLLVDGPVDAERFGGLAELVPMNASPDAVVTALRETVERGLSYEALGADAARVASGSHGGGTPAPAGTVVVLTSGKGAPGKTTLAIALAAELARRGGDIALVDADLRGGNVATCLDLDPGRGLVALRRGEPAVESLEGQLQDGLGFRVVAGFERPELAGGVPLDRIGGVVAALRQRCTHVVVDAGCRVSGPGQAWQRQLLGRAERVLVVTGADLVSAWNTRVAVDALVEQLDPPWTRLAALVNRRAGQEHYGPAEFERALGIPVLAAVREDRAGARRALAAQRPLSAASRGVARDLRPLVELLGEQGGTARRAAWRMRVPALPLPWPRGAAR